MNEYDVSAAFQQIEELLIQSMTRNLGKHIKDQILEGFDWTMWQAEQLKAFKQFRSENANLFKGYFSTINSEIDKALLKANVTGQLTEEQKILKSLKKGYKAPKVTNKGIEGAFFKLNDRKMNALLSATQKDMQYAETAVLRMVNDQYRKTIFNAQVYANSGAGTVWQAADMATKDFLSSGINCIEYADGRRVNIASYAEMAIRTANKRAYLIGEGAKRDEWGVHTVQVSQYGACSPTCLPWQGKVYVDDVYSGGKPDGVHQMLSTAIAGGLFHPNCRHTTSTWFEGINAEPNPMDAQQTEENSSLEQQQRYNERQIRKYKRLEMGSLDPNAKAKYTAKREEWQQKNRDFIAAHPGILRRDYERESTRGLTLKQKIALKNPTIQLKRDLTKELAQLNTHIAQLDNEPDLLDVWKDPVPVKDYPLKKASIQNKKDYFKTKINDSYLDHAKKLEFTDKLKALNEWELKGIDYEDYLQKIVDVEDKLDRLTPKKFKPKSVDDPYSQKRKSAAMWAKTTKDADKELRQKCGDVWQQASKEAKEAAYDYTTGSGSFNRPLAGYRKPWKDYGSGWEDQYYLGSDKVWIDFEGKGDKIRKMTELIDQSEYDFDMWLQRGCDENAFEKFLGLSNMSNLSEQDLQKFVGTSNTFDNFISSSVNKGSGFSSKPITMNIYAPKGTKMLYAEPFSSFGNGDGLNWDGINPQASFGGEAEMIIQRGATYRITKIEKTGYRTYIDVEVRIEQGYNTFQQDPTEWKGSKDNYMT